MTIEPKKMIHEQVIEKLNNLNAEVVKEFAEVRSLLIVIDWAIGQNDFPPNVILSKEINELTLIAKIKQTTKLLEVLNSLMIKEANKANSLFLQAKEYLESKNKKES